MLGYLREHWTGRASLARAFWINFAALFVAYHLLEPLLQRPFVERPLAYIWITVVYLVLTRLVVFPWQVVGLLRCSDRHYRATGNRGALYATQAAVVVGLLATLVHLIDAAQLLMISKRAHERAALIENRGFNLTLSGRGELVRLDGPLAIGVTEALTRILNANPGVNGVVLNSPGGQTFEGRGVAGLLSTRGLDSYIFERCASACATAFVGGVNRYFGASARLGFHRYRFESTRLQQFSPFYDLAHEERKDRALFEARQVDAAFLDRIFSVPADEIWFPAAGELLRAGVVTHLVNAGAAY